MAEPNDAVRDRSRGKDVYIDSSVASAFKEAGSPDTISRKQLRMLSQIVRSSEASDIFRDLTGRSVVLRQELVELFRAVSSGELDLDTILKHHLLKEYSERMSLYSMS